VTADEVPSIPDVVHVHGLFVQEELSTSGKKRVFESEMPVLKCAKYM
jgi:hypothetical protein